MSYYDSQMKSSPVQSGHIMGFRSELMKQGILLGALKMSVGHITAPSWNVVRTDVLFFFLTLPSL